MYVKVSEAFGKQQEGLLVPNAFDAQRYVRGKTLTFRCVMSASKTEPGPK